LNIRAAQQCQQQIFLNRSEWQNAKICAMGIEEEEMEQGGKANGAQEWEHPMEGRMPTKFVQDAGENMHRDIVVKWDKCGRHGPNRANCGTDK
jgi:hypothetical protein